MRNKRSILLAIFLLFLVVSLPAQISASDTFSSEDFCVETSSACELIVETSYECRNNDTWKITVITRICPDRTTTIVYEDPWLSGQCPYGGPAS